MISEKKKSSNSSGSGSSRKKTQSSNTSTSQKSNQSGTTSSQKSLIDLWFQDSDEGDNDSYASFNSSGGSSFSVSSLKTISPKSTTTTTPTATSSTKTSTATLTSTPTTEHSSTSLSKKSIKNAANASSSLNNSRKSSPSLSPTTTITKNTKSPPTLEFSSLSPQTTSKPDKKPAKYSSSTQLDDFFKKKKRLLEDTNSDALSGNNSSPTLSSLSSSLGKNSSSSKSITSNNSNIMTTTTTTTTTTSSTPTTISNSNKKQRVGSPLSSQKVSSSKNSQSQSKSQSQSSSAKKSRTGTPALPTPIIIIDDDENINNNYNIFEPFAIERSESNLTTSSFSKLNLDFDDIADIETLQNSSQLKLKGINSQSQSRRSAPTSQNTRKTPIKKQSQQSQQQISDSEDYNFTFNTPSPLKEHNSKFNNNNNNNSNQKKKTSPKSPVSPPTIESSPSICFSPTPPVSPVSPPIIELSPTFSFMSSSSSKSPNHQQPIQNSLFEFDFSGDSPFKPNIGNNSQLSFSTPTSSNNSASERKNNLIKLFNESSSSMSPSKSKSKSRTTTTTTTTNNNNNTSFDSSLNNNHKNKNNNNRYERLVVSQVDYSVTHTFGSNVFSNAIHKKTLGAFSETRKCYREIHLFGEWIYIPVKSGDIVNVIGQFDNVTNEIIINSNGENLLILFPDILITGTELGGSLSCTRRSILKEQMRTSSKGSTIPMFGSIVHEIFQECLLSNKFTLGDINEFKEHILSKPSFQLGLSSLGETQESAKSSIDNWCPTILNWAKTFVTPDNSTASRSSANIIEINNEKWHLQITKILEIEENIWSIMYGLKGKIDSTLEIKLTQQIKSSGSSGKKKGIGNSPQQQQPTICYFNIPFEIKTGKPYAIPYVSHTSQVLIYTLLMNDRYNQNIELGMLYYLKNKEITNVGFDYGLLHPILFERNQIRSLLVSRNILAYFLNLNSRPLLKPNPVLPNMLRDKHRCSNCYSLDQCLMYHKSIENGTDETSGLGELFNQRTNHLSPIHIEYLKRWNLILSLESDIKNNSRKLIWSRSRKFAETNGTCIGDMVLQYEHYNQLTGSYSYTFSIKPDKLSLSLISEGDYLIISIENKYFGMGAGQVSSITPTSITITCREKLSEPPHLIGDLSNHSPNSNYYGANLRNKPLIDIEYEFENNGSNENIKNYTRGLTNYINNNNNDNQDNDSQLIFKWRVDTDEQMSSLSIVKSNVFNMFLVENQNICSLVVEKRQPQFSKLLERDYMESIDWETDYPLLNNDQKSAIIKTLSANDYSLILGMPGTGKTTLIITLIHILWKLGKTILIASFTHTSLDHLLLKVQQQYPSIEMLRLASSINQVDKKLWKFCLDTQKFGDITEVKQYLSKQTLVGTTCLGIGHQYFNSRGNDNLFDYCIIDEASQLSQPLTIGPLFNCKKFVLVGDHHQLPPIVNNKEAGKLGLDISLFKLLSTAHPSSVSNLYYQYRMNGDIMSLSNHLIYNNRLKCGNQLIENLKLSPPSVVQNFHDDNWPSIVCDINKSVLFIDTDQLSNHAGKESKFGDLFYNTTESSIVGKLVKYLINQFSVPKNQIGIITPSRYQIKYIRNSIIKSLTTTSGGDNINPIEGLDILTIDRFQGKDKDCIIISFVRSNDKKDIGDLIKDWKRMNVAFTRARKKLIFVGSRSTLCGFTFFADFFDFISKKGWIFNLDSNKFKINDNDDNSDVIVIN